MKKKYFLPSLGFIIVLGALISPLSMISFSPQPVMARPNQNNLIGQGTGVFNLQGRSQQEVRSVSLKMRNNQDADLTIILTNNQTMSFRGRATGQNAKRLRMDVRSSGMASANGTILIERDRNNILSLEGKGSLDGQSYSLIFRHQPNSNNSSFNLLQRGRGVLSIQGRKNQSINSVSVQVNNLGEATVSFVLQGGHSISFDGLESHRDSTNLKISLSNSGSASASGFINIRYGANNSIINLVGDGRIDSQPFLVNFSQ